ncbi:MAG TPA: hypothetical protein DCE60_03820 [Coprococcus sp.]|nr:hypothetical protein [Coprococcus sp.]
MRMRLHALAVGHVLENVQVLGVLVHMRAVFFYQADEYELVLETIRYEVNERLLHIWLLNVRGDRCRNT